MSDERTSEQKLPSDCLCSADHVRIGEHGLCQVEGRCYECDCVFFYTIDPTDPVYWKICDDCVTKGVIEP
jgi:hypothetical protein